MAATDDIELVAIGRVESPLTDPASAPKQGDEGSPPAWLVFDPAVAEGLDGIAVGDDVIVLTWLHEAARDVLRVHPRGDPANPERGVFATRSPARPNPIGLHRVRIVSIDGLRFGVRDLEAIGRDADRRRQAAAARRERLTRPIRGAARSTVSAGRAGSSR